MHVPRRSFPLLLSLVAALAWAPASRGEEGRHDAPAPTCRLRVATYNVWLIPIVSTDRGERLARLPGALRAQALDVLALQEVWLASDARQLARALAPELPHAAHGAGGLLLLSRFPIREHAFLPFPRYTGLSIPERLAGKGLLDAVLTTPRGPVRVVTTHLALAFGPDNPRSKQLAFLLRRLAKQRSVPTILAADLNTWPVEDGLLTADYRALLAAGFTDAKPPRRLPGGRYDPGAPTRIGWPRPERKTTEGWYPDHLLYRDGRSGRLALRAFRLALHERDTALSDHNLLRAELRLTDRRPPPGAGR